MDYPSGIVYAALSHDVIRIRKEPFETAELASDRRIRQGERLFGIDNTSDDGNWAGVYIDGIHTGWITKNLFETNGNTNAGEWVTQNNISLLQ